MIMRKTGFTLIELLIAATISAVIILSLFSAFQTGILSFNRIDSSFNVYQSARVIFSRMEADLKNAFVYSQADSKFKGSANSINLFSVTDVYEEGVSYPEVCGISYGFYSNTLTRAVLQGMDSLTGKETPDVDELSLNVREISFQYASSSPSDPAKTIEWLSSWPKENDLEQAKTLPSAVKIKLLLMEKDKRQKEIGLVEFTKTIPLPSVEKPTLASIPDEGAANE